MFLALLGRYNKMEVLLMKRIITLLAIVVLVFSLTACGGKTGSTKNTTGSSTLGPSVSGDNVTFNFKPAKGTPQKVFVAGSFNGWKPDNAKYALEDLDGDGIWSLTVKMNPGKYEYKYVVDGTWTTDKNAKEFKADPYGGKNSMVTVK